MKAELRVVVRDGRLVELSGQPPLTAKLLPGGVLQLVSSAASMLEGDQLRVEIDLGPGCALAVRSVAAQLAFPCLGEGTTRWCVNARLGSGARLDWAPEPLVACGRSRHRSTVSIDLAEDAALLWRDELLLGRFGEPVESVGVRSELRIRRSGRPVLHDGLATDLPGSLGPAVLGGARYLGTIVDLGADALSADGDPPAMQIAGGGTMLRLVGADAISRTQLDRRLLDATVSA